MIVDGQHSAADIQIEDVLLPAHAECGVFDGGDHESSLGPLALDGFGGDTSRGSDFREGGACVTFAANSCAAVATTRDRVGSACC